MSKITVIDPGHGGADPGAVNGKRYEKDDTLRLALAVKAQLEAQGQTVLLTRANDTFPSLQQRTNQANAAKADLYISIHRNSHTTSSAKGIETWVYTSAGTAETAMAGEVQERLCAVACQSNRGVKKGNYHVCRETTMPAMLVELGFISNAKDNELFDNHFSGYAQAIAQGACAALGEAWKEGGKTVANPLYRVQVGAFRSRANAEAFVAQVRALNLDAFVIEYEVDALFRVQVGAFKSEQNARNYMQTVKDLGLEAFLVLPAGEQLAETE